MILLALAVALAGVDAWTTHKRLKWEINPLVKWLVSPLGTTGAVLVGVLLIQSLLAWLLWVWNPLILALMVGASLYRSWTQLYSMKYLT